MKSEIPSRDFPYYCIKIHVFCCPMNGPLLVCDFATFAYWSFGRHQVMGIFHKWIHFITRAQNKLVSAPMWSGHSVRKGKRSSLWWGKHIFQSSDFTWRLKLYHWQQIVSYFLWRDRFTLFTFKKVPNAWSKRAVCVSAAISGTAGTARGDATGLASCVDRVCVLSHEAPRTPACRKSDLFSLSILNHGICKSFQELRL